MGRPTLEQAGSLAPDANSLRAGRKLAVPSPWSGTACNDRAVWGACRGSAKLPYTVAVDTVGPAYKCSCPSRKSPCKHALALLLLWAQKAAIVAEGQPPPDVAAWLASRSATHVEGDLADAVAATGPPPTDSEAAEIPADAPAPRARDPEAAKARAEQRSERIAAGMEELDRWLGDLVRHGLGHAETQPYGFWDAMAARLVDAQAPAAANRVRKLAGVVRSGPGWPGRLLAQVCRLHLLAAGWARYRRLPETVQADLRTAAGWPWPSELVLAGARESDRWYVLARSVTDEEQVRAQRTWLWGLESGRLAVLVDFARPGQVFTWDLWPGNVLPATLARFPGSAPLRVLVAERGGEPEAGGSPPGWAGLEKVAAARGHVFAADPWLSRWPVSVTGVVVDHRGGRWWLTDSFGRTIALATGDEGGWRLLSLSAGRPVQLLGEWEEDGLTPLGAWADDRMVVL